MRPAIARAFENRPFPGGLTYNSHPLGCAAALATIRVYEDEGLVENARQMGVQLRAHAGDGAAAPLGRSDTLDRAFRPLRAGAEPATYAPMAPFNGTSDEMAALGRAFRERGCTFVRWNTFFANPPAHHVRSRWTRLSRSSNAGRSPTLRSRI